MLFTALLFLAASGVTFADQQCTEVRYPTPEAIHGKYQVNISPVQLPGVTSNVTLSNTCSVTNGVVVNVCDDVAPAIVPVNLFFFTVQRRGTANGSTYLSGTFYCD